EIDNVKKELVKVIRSREYLNSVKKKGEGVEWNPNIDEGNKYQQFIDENNKYLDSILEKPWESKLMKDKFKNFDKLMVIYNFLTKVDEENLLSSFLKKWDDFWKPKWEKLVSRRFESLKKIETINDRIFNNLKKQNKIDDDEIECVKLVNKYRVKLGFNPLLFNQKLYNAAGIHAGYLDRLAKSQQAAKKEISLSHYQQNTDTIKPEDRAKKAGYNPTILGENIAYAPNENKNTPAWMVEGWRHSPFHHNGLIQTGVNEIGCYKENFVWVLLVGSEK
ncbi:MAG: CAP domain-containing protein, partial [Planctomycetota bacterium]